MNEKTAIATTRIALGCIFLWAFIDKMLGLGFATCKEAGVMCENAWLAGGSPTTGFLGNLDGMFASAFKPLAGLTIVDWIFMLGLLCIGIALVLGIGMKIAAWSGALLMVLMWLAELPLANHPLLDDHIIYALVLWLLSEAAAGDHYGLGSWWKQQEIAKKYPWLQ